MKSRCTLKILSGILTAILLLTGTAVPFSAEDNVIADVLAAAEAYVTETGNNATADGLRNAVKAVNSEVRLLDEDFFVKHAVPGVKDDDTQSGYPLEIPGSDGAVAAVFILKNEKIGFSATFAHTTEIIHIESYAIAGDSAYADNFSYITDCNGISYVTEYTGTADKLIFPSDCLVTMADKNSRADSGRLNDVKVVFIDTPTPEKWGWDANKWVRLQQRAFSGWENLRAVQFGTNAHNGLLSDRETYNDIYNAYGCIPSIFADCPELQYAKLPDETYVDANLATTYTVPTGMFENCRKLQNVSIPKNTGGSANYGIAWNAFKGTAVRDIFSPAGVIINNIYFSKPFENGLGNYLNDSDNMTFCRAAALIAAKVNELINSGVTDKNVIISQAFEAVDGAVNALELRNSLSMEWDQDFYNDSFRLNGTLTVKYGTDFIPVTVKAIKSQLKENIIAAAKHYVSDNKNNVTSDGLLNAVKLVNPSVELKSENFFIRHSVPGVADNDTKSGYKLNISGSKGAVAAVFELYGVKIGFSSAFDFDTEVVNIGEYAIAGDDNYESDFTYYTDDKGIKYITGYTGTADKIIFPCGELVTMAPEERQIHREQLNNVKVVIIDTEAYYPYNYVVRMQGSAFSGWRSLKAVQFGKHAHEGILQNLDYYNGNTPGIFANCPELKYVRLPDMVYASPDIYTLPDGIFEGCEKLENVNIPANSNNNTSKGIAYNSFKNTAVRDIYLPEGVNAESGFIAPVFEDGTGNVFSYNENITFCHAAALISAKADFITENSCSVQFELKEKILSAISISGLSEVFTAESDLYFSEYKVNGVYRSGLLNLYFHGVSIPINIAAVTADADGIYDMEIAGAPAENRKKLQDILSGVYGDLTEGEFLNGDQYGINNTLLTYVWDSETGSNAVPESVFLPSAAYMKNGVILDTMFDSFLFTAEPNYLFAYGDTSGDSGFREMTKKDWYDFIHNKLFIDGMNVDALDSAVGKIKSALGLSDYKVSVIFTLFYPVRLATDFGEVDGKRLNLTFLEDRKSAVKWMIDEYISAFEENGYENINLSGFYWYAESINFDNGDPDILKVIKSATDYIRSLNMVSMWLPYYTSSGYSAGRAYGFDLVAMQPNFFPEELNFPNTGSEKNLYDTAEYACRFNMGVMIESGGTESNSVLNLKKYYRAGIETGYVNAFNAYYMRKGPKMISDMYLSANRYVHSAYDETYKFIKNKLYSGDIIWRDSESLEFDLENGGREQILNTAKSYVNAYGNDLTYYGLLDAVKTIYTGITLAKEDFFIKHAVPGVKDDDTKSGYPLNIPGSDGAVAAVFKVGETSIGFTAAFPHETETIHIGSYAIVGDDRFADDFTYEKTDAKYPNVECVTDYTGNADKLIFPKDAAVTMAAKDKQKNPAAFKNVKVVYIDTDYPSNWDETKYVKMQNAAFSGWLNLKAVQFGEHANNTILSDWKTYYNGLIPNIFAECPNLKYAKLPDKMNVADWLYALPTGIFSGCAKLENANLPDNEQGCHGIAYNAFEGTAVRDIFCKENTSVNRKSFINPSFNSGIGNVYNYDEDMTFCRAAALASAKANEGAAKDEILNAIDGSHNAAALRENIQVGSHNGLTLSYGGVTFTIEVKGDINNDGERNSMDLSVLRKHLLGITVDADTKKCDVNNNGVTDIIDFILLKKMIVMKCY